MKKIVFVLISLVVTILVIVGNGFAKGKTPEASIPDPPLGPEWKLLGIKSDGTAFYVNTRMTTYSPVGIAQALILLVPRGEDRRGLVNDFKHDLLSEGRDPNNAERLWYETALQEVNCKTHQITVLEVTAYSFEKTVIVDESAQYEEWKDIVPGTASEAIERYACK